MVLLVIAAHFEGSHTCRAAVRARAGAHLLLCSPASLLLHCLSESEGERRTDRRQSPSYLPACGGGCSQPWECVTSGRPSLLLANLLVNSTWSCPESLRAGALPRKQVGRRGGAARSHVDSFCRRSSFYVCLARAGHYSLVPGSHTPLILVVLAAPFEIAAFGAIAAGAALAWRGGESISLWWALPAGVVLLVATMTNHGPSYVIAVRLAAIAASLALGESRVATCSRSCPPRHCATSASSVTGCTSGTCRCGGRSVRWASIPHRRRGWFSD